MVDWKFYTTYLSPQSEKHLSLKWMWLWMTSFCWIFYGDPHICKTKSQFVNIVCSGSLIWPGFCSRAELHKCAWQSLKQVTGQTTEWSLWQTEFPNPGIMLKSKIPLSKFAGLIGFIKQFMNRAASHLATRRKPPIHLLLNPPRITVSLSKEKSKLLILKCFHENAKGKMLSI